MVFMRDDIASAVPAPSPRLRARIHLFRSPAATASANERGAIAKIEELLDVVSDNSWTFAHEFAHLVYFHLDDARAKPFEQLYARAKQAKYATTSYALKNDDELFAVSYTDYLRHHYGLSDTPIEDDAGVQRALMSYFAELCVA